MPEKLDAFRFVIDQLSKGAVRVDPDVESLDSIGAAWSRQESFPHAKIVVSLV